MPSIGTILDSLSPSDKVVAAAFSSMSFNGDLNDVTFSSLCDDIITPSTPSCIDDDGKVNAHYLWSCGVWTTSKQEARYFDKNLYISPQFAVIEPKNINNTNILSGLSPDTISYHHLHHHNQSQSCQDLHQTLSNPSSCDRYANNYTVI